jgi:hypothetical protein
MQRTVRFSAIAADNVASFRCHPTRERVVKNSNNSAPEYQCQQTTCSSASKRTKKNFPQDALHWRTMLCAGVTETRRSIVKPSSRVKAIFSDA